MKEIWKTVITPEGVYENYKVSNLGRVKSLNYHREKREKILFPEKDRKDYLFVNIYKNGKGKHCSVHRLVAYAFIPNIMNYKCIDHRDTNKKNNATSNLCWCTHKQNNNNKLTIAKKTRKKVICVETCEIFESVKEASEKFKIHAGNIATVCRGKRKQAGKLTFRYLDQVLFYN